MVHCDNCNENDSQWTTEMVTRSACTHEVKVYLHVFQKLKMKIVSKLYRNIFFRSWALQPLTHMVIFVISCMYASNSKLLMLSASATLFTYENDATYFWCIQFVELLSGKNEMVECRMTWPFSMIYTKDLVKRHLILYIFT